MLNATNITKGKAMTAKEFKSKVEELGGEVWEKGGKLRGYFSATKGRGYQEKLGFVCYSGEGIEGDDENGEWVNDFVGFVEQRPGTHRNIMDIAHDVAGVERKGF